MSKRLEELVARFNTLELTANEYSEMIELLKKEKKWLLVGKAPRKKSCYDGYK